jgi:MFS family permease
MSTITPRQQLLVMLAGTKLADVLASTKTTLPWLVNALGLPGWVISVLVPIRESGALLPQWWLKQRASIYSNRVQVWRAGMLGQLLGIGALGAVTAFAQDSSSASSIAGLVLIIGLILASCSRALSSLAIKDIQGIVVEENHRGKLVGTASSISGALSLIGAGLVYFGGQSASAGTALVLLLAALGALTASYLAAQTLSASYDDSKKTNNSNKLNLRQTLAQNPDLRTLIINRSLLAHSALLTPFLVAVMANQWQQLHLAFLIGASAIATFLSSYFWGLLADISARNTLMIAAGICLASVAPFLLLPQASLVTELALFTALQLGHAGIRTGRKTYAVDIAEDEQRTAYVASANTIIGLVLLCLGGFYALLYQWFGYDILLIMLVALALGAVHTRTLKN